MTNVILEKLNYKSHMNMTLINCPEELLEILTPTAPQNGNAIPFIVIFFKDSCDIKGNIDIILAAYQEKGCLWCAYPKKSGSIKSDISRDKGWELLIAKDLLPVSQVALNSTWSALRFRYRNEIKKLTRSFANKLNA